MPKINQTSQLIMTAAGLLGARSLLIEAERAGLRLKHDLFGKPVSTFPDHALIF
jgi:hypothetical protein